jgi:DNA-3-methyladenine glycosylase II
MAKDHTESCLVAPKLKSIKSIQTYLATQDKQLARALKNAPLYPVAKQPAHNSHFETIVFAVIGQQLSGKAADTITHRLIKKSGSPVKPRKVIKLGHDELRAVGLSNAKARTILELSQAVVDGFDLESVDQLSDEEILKELTKFWGIGRWTVEMFMMFRLGRLDIWPIGDLGVRKGWAKIQGIKGTPTEKEVIGVADHLRPYRSVVAWHCWRMLDEEPDFW